MSHMTIHKSRDQQNSVDSFCHHFKVTWAVIFDHMTVISRNFSIPRDPGQGLNYFQIDCIRKNRKIHVI